MQRIVVARRAAGPAGRLDARPATHPPSVLSPATRARHSCRVGPDRRVQVGTGYSTGGSGLAVGDALPADYSGGIVVHRLLRTRCGGTIALILDVRLRAGPGRRCGAEGRPSASSAPSRARRAASPSSVSTGRHTRCTRHPEYGSYLTAQPVRRGDGGQEPHPADRTEDGPTPRFDQIGTGTNWETACGGPSAPMRRLCPADRAGRRGVLDRRRSQPGPPRRFPRLVPADRPGAGDRCSQLRPGHQGRG